MDDALLPSWDAPFLSEFIYRHNNVRSADGDNVILMQFTGFLDKNGKEVYEDDIMSAGNGDSIVMMDQECGEWIVNGGERDGSDMMLYVAIDIGAKVIGNIFENPELLNKTEVGNG
jgi:uncharacterized phage protein (TIGR01671 family)